MHSATILALALFATTTGATAQTLGCGQPVAGSGTYSLTHDGIDRTYRLHLPRGYDPDNPAPLVLAFHGWGGTADSLLDYRVVRRQANAAGAIVVAPVGLGPSEDRPSSWTFPGSATGLDGDGINAGVPGDSAFICNPAVLEDETYPSCGPVGSGTAQSICSWTQCQTDDVAFVDALLDEIEATHCVDTGRILAAGVSNGGAFVWGLGQDAAIAPRFRAMASVIGLPHRGYLDGPARPVPMLLITGQTDPIVPPGDWDDPGFTTSADGEEFYYTGATAITRAWAEAQGCDTTSPATAVDTGVRGLDCRSYCAGDDDALPAVLDCRLPGGHDADLRRTWPLVMDFLTGAP